MRYVVSYINFFNNELTSQLVEGKDEIDAILNSAWGDNFDLEEMENNVTHERFKQEAFNMDSMIHAFPIPDKE